jgi:PAS domain S-box-containing protein
VSESDEALRASEQRYRALFNAMTEGLALHEMIFDAAGAPVDYRFLDVNPAFERLTGLARDRVVGRTVREVLPGIEPAWIETYGRVVLTGEPARIESFAGPLGRFFEVQAYRPAPGQFVASFLDVTERKRVEEALRDSEDRYRRLFETMIEGFILAEVVTDDLDAPVDYRFLDVNAAGERFFGRSREALVGRTYRTIGGSNADPVWIDALGRVALTGEALSLERYAPVGGHWVHLVAYSPRARQFAAVFSDITERRTAEEALRDLNRTLEDRVAERTSEVEALAGELRGLAAELTRVEHQERQRIAKLLHDHAQQLLVAAKLHVGMLVNRQPDARLEAAARLAGELLEQTLAALRSLTAELSPPVLFDSGLGPGLQWLARSLAEKHGLIADLAFDPRGEPVLADVRVFLFDAVRELLFNVVKHAGVSRAHVEVTRERDGHVRVVVSDGGRGFDPVQACSPRGSRGFGLFSIQQRLQHMGGRMDIDSAPGRGARIILVAPSLPEADHPVPTAAGAAVPAPATIELASRGPGAVIRVVLADDHQIMRQGLASLLRMETDMEIAGEASDGLEAVALARSLRPDVVVMDVSMPNMNGVEATRCITSELSDVRVIGLSLHDTGDMAAAMKAAGAVHYLSKGGPSDVLIAAIRRAAGRGA